MILDGWVADAARTFPVGPVSPVAHKLLSVTEQALLLAVPQCRVGNRLGDVSHAIQEHVEAEGFSIVRSLVGHGIGRSMHEDPQIPNYGAPGTGVPLEEGMVLAVEPMVTAGRHARPGRRGPLVYLLPGRLAGRALRVHHRRHRVRAARADPVARGRERPRRGLVRARRRTFRPC